MKKYRYEKMLQGGIIEGDTFCELVTNYDSSINKAAFVKEYFPLWNGLADGNIFTDYKELQCYIVIIILINTGKIQIKQ